MSDTVVWKYGAWLALISSPLLPIAFAWQRRLADRRAHSVGAFAPLFVVTLSSFWVDAVAADWSFLGSPDGNFRFAIVGGNLIAVLLAGFAWNRLNGFRLPSAERIAVGVACLLLIVEWLLVGVVVR
jgi:hypothetical protein